MDAKGRSALSHAAESSSIEVFKLLSYFSMERIINAINLDVADDGGCTPFLRAVHPDRVEAVRYLLTKGFNLLVKTTDGLTALQLATSYGPIEMLKLLLNTGINVDFHIEKNDAALVRAYHRHVGRASPLSLLLDSGADPNIQSRTRSPGSTPLYTRPQGKKCLHHAAKRNNFKAKVPVKDLQLGEANFYASDSNEETGLHIAAKTCNPRIVAALLLLTEPSLLYYFPDQCKRLPFHYAIRSLEVTKLLLRYYKYSSVQHQDYFAVLNPDESSQGSLARVKNDMIENIGERLVKRKYIRSHLNATWGEDEHPKLWRVEALNSRDDFGNTSLHYASLTSCLDVVKLNLDIPNVDLFVQNNDSETALDFAMGNRFCATPLLNASVLHDGKKHSHTLGSSQKAAGLFMERLGKSYLYGVTRKTTELAPTTWKLLEYVLVHLSRCLENLRIHDSYVDTKNTSNSVFRDSTIRQTFHVSIPADRIRIQLSNIFGGSALTIDAASLALPTGGTAGESSIIVSSLVGLTFNGSASVTIPEGQAVYTDPIDYSVEAQSMVALTLYTEGGQTGNNVTGHPGSRTTTWMEEGNHVNDTSVATASVEHWYFATALEAWVPADTSAFIILGDSITDGRESDENENDRWPDLVLAKMQNNNVTNITNISVNNEAAGGNRVLLYGLGPALIDRYKRDAIEQPGVKYVMIFEGVNDIGVASTDQATQTLIGDELIAAYEQIAADCRNAGLATFIATITPFSGAGEAYSNPTREQTRQRVNTWIKSNNGTFDAVLDFDSVLRDPSNPSQMLPVYNSGDWLHPNHAGYEALASYFPIDIFAKFGTRKLL
ncbi:hypothetical protein B7494_g5241 [Chlorociboria aeruginascens]|nr:hypothetical protein B7494_g5241 [Chlorociboria aeruginascens]